MLNRRELITALLGWQVAASSGCSRRSLPDQGELLRTNFGIGHRIRDGHRPTVADDDFQDVGVVIVGGGVAGLSAAWRMLEAGFQDFVLLELETQAGGTARGGSSGGFSYPWGAHYVPVPMSGNRTLIKLLDELNVVDRILDDGSPVIGEQFLCRDPHERLYCDGRWHEGLYPFAGASPEDLRQLDEFRAEVDRWVELRDDAGRRMFAIPMAGGSDAAEVRALDQQTMAAWMDERRWSSPRLRWLVDYACRDDYGLSIDRVSAWAGLFYFAARVPAAGQESQSVITWPEGNGRIVRHLAERAASQVRCGHAVCEVAKLEAETGRDRLSVTALDTERQQAVGFRAQQVIFAAPQFLANHLIRGIPEIAERDRSAFQYGSWLVANVHLRDRPAENGFPMCWDNVIYGTRSLGYVTATHQMGIDHGPTVLTWYYPFADAEAKITRQQMLQLTWADWCDLVLTDLRVAHPDIDALVTRIDIMCWGHAMIQPRPGFIWSRERIDAARPVGAIHFAGTDLSGVPLLEEALYHGVRAAEEVLTARRMDHSSLF
jgi:phytoene dehydrogenase-like protein